MRPSSVGWDDDMSARWRDEVWMKGRGWAQLSDMVMVGVAMQLRRISAMDEIA
jgi:hypothetical protein